MTIYPVKIVGAGPGAPDLITVRGLRALQGADAVLYAGSLVNPELLTACPEGCVCRDSAGMALEDQLKFMIEAARAGKKVVRLHTGDPAMYGAINEQISGLAEAGIRAQIIPGVSSVFAAAAALGCELTSPETSQSLVLTRTPGRTPMPAGEDAATFARTGATLAFFLSTGRAGELMDSLMREGGLAPETPAAVVYRATWPDERILRGTVADIAGQIADTGFGRQALILVGQALTRNPAASRLYDHTFSHGYRNTLASEMFRGECALYACTDKALIRARELAAGLGLPCTVYTTRPAGNVPGVREENSGEAACSQEKPPVRHIGRGSLPAVVEQQWNRFDAHIFITATGIAVRAIAKLIRNKATDPAVIACTESGSHVISLVSGHLGGANRLARRVARITGGQAVVSTATDVNGLPAFDEVAAQYQARILNPGALRVCNSALLAGEAIDFCGPRDIFDAVFKDLPTLRFVRRPEEISAQVAVLWGHREEPLLAASDSENNKTSMDEPSRFDNKTDTAGALPGTESATISETVEENFNKKASCRDEAGIKKPCRLRITPRAFVLGVGCRAGIEPEVLFPDVENFLAEHGLTPAQIARLASCDVKQHERAILLLGEQWGVPIDFYPAETLAEVPVPTPSDTVQEKVGTPSVCEASALLSAGFPAVTRPEVRKTVAHGVTLALARLPHGEQPAVKRGTEDTAGCVENKSAAPDSGEIPSRKTKESLFTGGVMKAARSSCANGFQSVSVKGQQGTTPTASSESGNAAHSPSAGCVVVVGLGSGAPGQITPEVDEALRHCDVAAGYMPYVDLIRDRIPGKPLIQNGMMGELARCRATLEAAADGKNVCMVCSGDPGILAMAGLLYELRTREALFSRIPIRILPGITAASVAAASLGAPLQNGFCLVSLSDLLTPTEEIRANLHAVAQCSLPVTLYNPAGKKRRHMLAEALAVFREHRGNDTLCAYVYHAGRPQEKKWIGRLQDFPADEVDMSTVVLIGGPRTRQDGDILFELRGYAEKYPGD